MQSTVRSMRRLQSRRVPLCPPPAAKQSNQQFLHPHPDRGREHGKQGGKGAPPELLQQHAYCHHRQALFARGIFSNPISRSWFCLGTCGNNLFGPVLGVQHLSFQRLYIEQRLLRLLCTAVQVSVHKGIKCRPIGKHDDRELLVQRPERRVDDDWDGPEQHSLVYPVCIKPVALWA